VACAICITCTARCCTLHAPAGAVHCCLFAAVCINRQRACQTIPIAAAAAGVVVYYISLADTGDCLVPSSAPTHMWRSVSWASAMASGSMDNTLPAAAAGAAAGGAAARGGTWGFMERKMVDVGKWRMACSVWAVLGADAGHAV
jgi:hypothetical protein